MKVVALELGSIKLDDETFLHMFEALALPPEAFRHADHLRLAWLMLDRYGVEGAQSSVKRGIRAFAAHHGASHIYHETVTLGWVRLIATHDEQTFAEFLRRNDARLNKETLHRFWSPELLSSDLARQQWVAPDREPLPSIAPGYARRWTSAGQEEPA